MPSKSSKSPSSSSASAPDRASAGSSEGGRRPTGEEPAAASPRPQRWSARRKVEIALRALRGESLDGLSRETRQPAARVSEWRDAFLAAGEAGLKSHSGDESHEADIEECRRLQAKIGELTMEKELLFERCHKLEAGLPPAQRRSRR